MEQARKRNSIEAASRHAWRGIIRAVNPFTSADKRHPKIEVCYLDWTNFRVLQITSVDESTFKVTDLVVNNEFQPALAYIDQFHFLRFPVPMQYGSSFGAVLKLPSAAEVPMDCRYSKEAVSLVISTDHGDFTFHAGEVIRPGGNPRR